MHGDPIPIRSVHEIDGHPRQAEARKLWIIVDALFADMGGAEMVSRRLAAYHDIRKPRWDEHFVYLRDHGQSEASASRTVVQQLIVAIEFIS